jgi:hypothetical protein
MTESSNELLDVVARRLDQSAQAPVPATAG